MAKLFDQNILNCQLKNSWDQQILQFKNNDKKKQQIQQKIEMLEKNMKSIDSENDINKSILYSQLFQKIDQLQNELDLLNSNIEQISYIQNANQLVIDYNFDESSDVEIDEFYSEIYEQNDTINIQQNNAKQCLVQKEQPKQFQNNMLDNFEQLNEMQKNCIKRKNIIQHIYKDIIENSTDKVQRKITTMCLQCNVEKIFYSDSVVCEGCGVVEYNLLQSEQCAKTMVEKQKYPYKRINHLIEWLNQLQAKESIYIPKKVYSDLLVEIKKNRLTYIYQITYKRVKSYLKKLHYNQYYEHIPYIISKITGQPAPTLTKAQETEIKTRFKLIQEPFDKYRPNNRVNFMSYSFILSKLFRLVKINKYISYFALLKSKQKLWQQDLIWQKICNDLSWKFIPSI